MVGVVLYRGKQTSPCSCSTTRCRECNWSSPPCSTGTLGHQPHVFSCERGRTEVVKYGLADEALLGIFSRGEVLFITGQGCPTEGGLSQDGPTTFVLQAGKH